MFHNPTCIKCQVEYKPIQTGIGILDMRYHKNQALWEADKWRCPNCGNEIAVNFAPQPIAELPNVSRLDNYSTAYEANGKLVRNYL